MPLPLNPALQNLPVYQPGRPIEEVARELGLPASDFIKLASNENPLGPSPLALAAMRNVLENLHMYPDGNAFYVKRKLAERLTVAPENLILGNGSNEIIEFVGHALLEPGTDVVVSEYCFAVYPIVTRLFGANLIQVPAQKFGHDLPAMAKAITPKTRVVFVANPNNPTGTLISNHDVLRFIEAVPPHVLIAMDEAYIDFLEEPLNLIPLILTGHGSNLLLMRTFSKIFGLAGLRLGYGIACPEIISALEKIRQPFNINSIAQAGAMGAMDDVGHYEATRANNLAGMKFFEQAFEKRSWEYVPSSANFILLKTPNAQKVFQQLQSLGVIVRPMGGYQLPEWIRISIGAPQENEKCLAALSSLLPAP